MNKVLIFFALLACITFPHADVYADSSYPSKPVTIVVPYVAGGGNDTLARNLASLWSTHWKKPVVVINRTGGDGMIGTQYALSQPADGYTILMQVNQALYWPVVLPSANIDITRDFRLISKIQQNAMVFTVASSQPDQTFADFLSRCKTSTTPCSFGAATKFGEVMGKRIIEQTGLNNSVVVPYKSTIPMVVDALGGHVSIGMTAMSVAMPHIRTGAFRPLAIGSTERMSELPNVPTLKELGLNLIGVTWYGIMVKAGTPDDAFQAIVEAVNVAAHDPQILNSIKNDGAIPTFSSPAAFEEQAKEEMALMKPLLQKYLLEQDK